MTDRKKPTAGFWITLALVAVLVGYPLSFGVTRWLVVHHVIPKWLASGPLSAIYYPIPWLYRNGPEWLHDAIGWYFHLWE